MSNTEKPPSVLDDLGEEITGVAWPVSVCMVITIFLVRVLNPGGASSSSTVFIASAGYDETKNPDASSSEKLGGALLNAVIFICVIVGMTLLLVLLFKYECYRVIFAYMGFAVANIFFLITGLLIVLLCQRGGVHVDAFSLVYILFNFSVVGTLGVLFMPIPLLMKQCYMVWVGIIVAYIFTWIPDWTSWVLLVAMALYDIAAVLIPGGPLKWLVDLAVERQQAIPALIYESRPAGGYRGAGAWRQQPGAGDSEQPPQQEMTRQDGRPGEGPGEPYLGSQSQQQLLPPQYQQQQQHQGAGAVGGTAQPSAWAAASPAEPLHPQQQQQWGARPGQGGPVGEGVEQLQDAAAAGVWLVQGASTDRATLRHLQLSQQGLRVAACVQPADVRSGHPLGEGVEEEAGYSGRGMAAGLGAGLGSRGRSPRVAGPGALGPVAEGHQQDGLQQPLVRRYDGDASDLDPDSPEVWRQGGAAPPVVPGGEALASGPGTGSGAGHSPAGGTPAGGRRGTISNSGTASVTSVVMGMASTAVAPAPMPQQQYPPVPVQPSQAQYGEGQHVYPDGDPDDPRLQQGQGQQQDGQQGQQQAQRQADDDDGLYLPDGIKLGLGDFIFYSMLVGKAAMYDMMTVYASFIGIIAGLGLTLLCLAIYQRALPALPFSIALGVVFYFLTRIVLEPYIVILVTAGTYY